MTTVFCFDSVTVTDWLEVPTADATGMMPTMPTEWVELSP